MNARAIPTGANPQTTRQSFIDAEIAKAGIMAFDAKYGIDELEGKVRKSVMDAWNDGRGWSDLREYKSDLFRSGVVPAEREDMDRKAKLIEQSLERLDKAYKEAKAGKETKTITAQRVTTAVILERLDKAYREAAS